MKITYMIRETLPVLLLALLCRAALGQSNPGGNPHGTIGLDCRDCHTTEGWRPIKAHPAFDHQTTSFPLEGRHMQVQCAVCHTDLDFSKAGTRCKDCHLDVHRGQFAYACSECHTPRAWNNEREMFQRHQQTRFPLTGVHASVDCQACHATGQYAGVSVECGGCHLQAFQQATSPVNHVAEGFSTDCSQCHSVTTAGWANPSFHSGGFAGVSHPCYSCHQANFQSAADPNHVAGNFGHDCGVCHTPNGWHPANFDHNVSGFVLTGAHATVQCAQCHTVNGQPRYTGTPTDCYSCHQANFQNTTNPNHVTGNFPHGCTQCHTTTAWQPATFDHNLSSFPLTGAHVSLQCAQCHANGQFANTPTECYSCHTVNFNGAANPDHAGQNFPHDCTICHNTAAWQPSTFNHATSAFPLTGAHATLQCAQCHANGQFANTPTDCFSCHTPDFNGANNPNHASQNFPHDCTVCHNNVTWQPWTFQHAPNSLTGAHATLQCAQCHTNGQFANTPTDCWSCHQTNFNGANNPNHASQNFPHDCTVCHNNVAWQPWTFQHAPSSLTGAHATLQCGQCHTNGEFANTPTDCWSCHQANFNGANNPNHASQNFPHDCTVCHNSVAWQPSTFNHQTSAFPLTGRHASVACNLCHVNGQYTNMPTACYACHQADYEGTRDPNHVALNYSHDCTQCHTTNGWDDGGGFNHANTSFPLTGAHANAQCAQCHRNGHFVGTPTECFACHRDNFEGASSPPHVPGDFSHICSRCHRTTAWQPSTFTHNSTSFPLTGAHVSLTCQSCHRGGPYRQTPTACYSCHQTDYQGVTDPNHVTGQFDHNCLACHTTTTWNPATFDHNNTNFPLTGAHLHTACNLCHIAGQFHGTPTDCYFCHQTDYNGATNPNHQAAGFPTTCATCHNTTAWTPATFDHDGPYFPIYSGHHQGTWTTCADCHTNPSDYAVFSCITCHEHSQSRMDNAHSDVSGYVYDSAHCYQCHPRGNSGGLMTAPRPHRNAR